jgi:hypothetical protein
LKWRRGKVSGISYDDTDGTGALHVQYWTGELRSVQREKVDITIGKVSSSASKGRPVGGKLKKRVMRQ